MLGIVLIKYSGNVCLQIYFHIKINFNIPEYLITPSLLPNLCALELELRSLMGMERYILEG